LDPPREDGSGSGRELDSVNHQLEQKNETTKNDNSAFKKFDESVAGKATLASPPARCAGVRVSCTFADSFRPR
jgi:hypothetical protein